MVLQRAIKKYPHNLNRDLQIFVTDWHNEDVPDENESNGSNHSNYAKFNDKFMIKAFGLDADGNSLALNIVDYKPYFYIKVPDNWNNNIATLFIENLKSKVWKKFSENLVSWRLLKSKPFYYFTGDQNYKFKFIKLMFSSYSGFKKYEYILRDKIQIPGINKSKPCLYQLYESNILPTLRFIHEKDLNASGWITIPKGKYHREYNETTCQIQLSCSYKSVEKFEKDDVPAINYASYDIEADSSHGDFPIAEKDYQKLARDIITEYNRLIDEQIMIKRQKIQPRKPFNIRGILRTLLTLVFNPNFNNNNIRSVKTIDNIKPNKVIVDEITQYILDIIESDDTDQDKTYQLKQLFDMYFPELDDNDEMDYLQLADQFVKDLKRLSKTNNIRFNKYPDQVIKMLISLAFNDYYDNNNCNVVYPIDHKRVPTADKLKCIVPTVYNLCEKCYQHVLKTRKNPRKVLKPGQKKITQDDFVAELADIFNNHFNSLEGDPIIQIGTVYKKYGDKHPFLKHIITMKSCTDITNSDLIDHENKDITLPKKDLIKEAEKLLGNDFDEKQLSDPDYYKKINDKVVNHRRNIQHEEDNAEVVVEHYDTEEDVIKAWVRLIRESDPDLIIGYNIFGFDFKYLYGRAKALGIEDELANVGRINWFQGRGGTRDETVLKEQKLSSSGLGDNTLYYLYMFGRVSIDLYKVAQKQFNLESYKLDFVCKKYLFKSKNDLPPADIFIKQKGTSDDRREIAEYCLIDCILVTRLLDKLDIIINNIGMSQVCSVPFSYLFLRGQGIKLLSFVSKICRLKGYLIPVLKKEDDGDNDESYEGAIVLTAATDIYLDDVVVVPDFNSLYPSCMISENLSHDSYVSSKIVNKGENTDFKGKLLNPDNQFEQMLVNGKFTGWHYVDVKYDLYEHVPIAPGRKKTKKVVKGHKICRFAQPPNGEKSIIPNILKELLSARKATRNTQKKYPKGSFKWNVLEGLQLAYKVTANSLYGQIGARTSAIFLMDIAACTTATGRNLIMFSKKFCESNYPGTHVVYGDSVSGDTPLILKNSKDQVVIKRIDQICMLWTKYEEFKADQSNRKNKQQSITSYKIWTNGEWVDIKRVIRHKTCKKMYRVNTYHGCVDVTEDHSLLDENGDKIKPADCVVNKTKLLHSFPDEFHENNKTIMFATGMKAPKQLSEEKLCNKCETIKPKTCTCASKCKACVKQRQYAKSNRVFKEAIATKQYIYRDEYQLTSEEAFVWGFFFGDGSCGEYHPKPGQIKHSWALNNKTMSRLDDLLEKLKIAEPELKFKVIDTIKSSGVYKLISYGSGSTTYLVNKYRKLFYDKDENKQVPIIIINANKTIKKAFLAGYYDANGSKTHSKNLDKNIRYCCKGKIGAQGLYYLFRSIGHKNLAITTMVDKDDIYSIYHCDIAPKNTIQKIIELPEVTENTFVYDIETASGKFNAGVGDLCIKNTDSLFVKFKTVDRYGNSLRGLDAINKSIELCLESSIAISKQLKPPHNLEFEKAIWPFILVSKKRYHGHYYTNYGKPSYYANSMGIVLKRRDNAKIVKHIFGGMTDIIMKEHSIPKAIEFIKTECKKMLNGEFPMDYFIITKTLRSYYKSPDQIAHNVLAQRIGKRDPGNKPQGNDRIPYAYIRVKNEDCLQGDRIETPDFIVDNKLKLDYRFYLIRQIIKPVSQILELVINNADFVFKNIITEYDNKIRGIQRLDKPKFAQFINFVDIKAVNVKKLSLEFKSQQKNTRSTFDDDIIYSETDDDIDDIDDIDSDDEKIR